SIKSRYCSTIFAEGNRASVAAIRSASSASTGSNDSVNANATAAAGHMNQASGECGPTKRAYRKWMQRNKAVTGQAGFGIFQAWEELEQLGVERISQLFGGLRSGSKLFSRRNNNSGVRFFE